MCCYLVPTAAAIIHYFMRRFIPSYKSSYHHKWLNLLLVGGAMFGVVDHLWNGELFLFGNGLLLDLALGLTITIVILIAWIIMVMYDKASITDKQKSVN